MGHRWWSVGGESICHGPRFVSLIGALPALQGPQRTAVGAQDRIHNHPGQVGAVAARAAGISGRLRALPGGHCASVSGSAFPGGVLLPAKRIGVGR